MYSLDEALYNIGCKTLILTLAYIFIMKQTNKKPHKIIMFICSYV